MAKEEDAFTARSYSASVTSRPRGQFSCALAHAKMMWRSGRPSTTCPFAAAHCSTGLRKGAIRTEPSEPRSASKRFRGQNPRLTRAPAPPGISGRPPAGA